MTAMNDVCHTRRRCGRTPVTSTGANRRMRENRLSGGVGGVTGAIPSPRPDRRGTTNEAGVARGGRARAVPVHRAASRIRATTGVAPTTRNNERGGRGPWETGSCRPGPSRLVANLGDHKGRPYDAEQRTRRAWPRGGRARAVPVHRAASRIRARARVAPTTRNNERGGRGPVGDGLVPSRPVAPRRESGRPQGSPLVCPAWAWTSNLRRDCRKQ